MSAWEPWDIGDEPALVRYVQTGVVRRLLGSDLARRLPGPGPEPRRDRAEAAYSVLADAGVGYVHEPSTSRDGRQEIRPPDQVLHRPGAGTCVELALVYAGMCLDAGLHPLIATLRGTEPGAPGHALVLVWLDGDWREGVTDPAYPLADPTVERIRDELDDGAIVAVDVTAATQHASWDDATAAGEAMVDGTDTRWEWTSAVDVGARYRARGALPMPGWPENREVLSAPYHPVDTRVGPLTRLHARRRPGQFTGRDELDVLLGWCTAEDDHPLRLAVVHGTGGAGKTHLAAELADRLAERGWFTGFLTCLAANTHKDTPAYPTPDDLSWLAGVVSPLLIVVDYAEAQVGTVKGLLLDLQAREQPACVILTARSTGDWWPSLTDDLDNGGIGHLRMDVPLPEHHRRTTAVFRTALRHFLPPGSDLPVDAIDEPAGRWTTLDLVLQGYLRAHGDTVLPETRTELYDKILRHEFDYWTEAALERQLNPPTRPLLRAAGACLSLLAPTKQRTATVLTAISTLDNDRVYAEQLAELLAHLMPSDDGDAVALRPDPIADHLMLAELGTIQSKPKDGEAGTLLRRALQLAEADEQLSAATVLTRSAALDQDTAGRFADEALRCRPDMWQPALAVAQAVGGPFAAALTSLAQRPDTELPLAELAVEIPLGHTALHRLALLAAERSLPPEPPDGSDNKRLSDYANSLGNLALRLADAGDRTGALERTEQVVAQFRALTDADAAYLPDLAMSLNNLGIRLSEAGRRADALTATEEAVTIRRALAQDQPAYLPGLAMSLNNLGAMLSEAGRRADALAATEEAVTHYRHLAEDSPAAYLPGLAMSLTNLGIRLSEAGRHADALTATEEAVTIRRALAQDSPAAYLPGLAMSLNNLGNQLSEAGRHADALTATEEAVTIRRALAQDQPAYLPGLAMSLNNLGNQLSETGRRTDALTATEEAVTHYRHLAEASPAAHLPDLAASLNNLGAMLSEAGRHADALTATEEAVTHYRHLAQDQPAAYLPDLAMSLNNLGSDLSAAGRRADALTATEEAVTHYRHLAQDQPAAHLPDLAMSLNNLGAMLSETGRRTDALTATQEAVTHYRHLAQDQPAAYLPDLAKSLNNLGAMLSETGRRTDALTTTQEAVTHYRHLAQDQPAAYLPDLATSLNNLGNRLSEAGRRADALTTTEEAVTHYRRLAQDQPAAHLPDLAKSLTNLGNRLSETGRHADALTTTQEAVTHYRHLAQDQPAAHLPDLATSLNNLGNRLSETGRHADALTTTQEAVTIRRHLAQDNPAAHLPDLAMSLNNLGNRLSEAGHDWSETAEHFEHAIAALQPGPSAELLIQRARWHLAADRRDEAAADITRARTAAEAETDPRPATSARLAVRTFHANLDTRAANDADDTSWTTAELHPNNIDILNAWLASADWPTRESLLANEAIHTPDIGSQLDLTRFLYPEASALDDLRRILDQIAEHGHDTVLTAYRTNHEHTELLRAWIAIPNWSESLVFARNHPELRLADKATSEMLRGDGTDSELVAYAAIAELSRTMDLADIYDAITDPEHAADLALGCLMTGDIHSVGLLAGVSPQLQSVPFTGPFITAVWLIVTDIQDGPNPATIIADAAIAGTPIQRQAGALRLTALAATYPDHADTLLELKADFELAGRLGAWIDTETWPKSLTFARAHPDLLADDRAIELLTSNDRGTAQQHAAIAILSRTVPLDDVYAAVTDPTRAATLALDLFERKETALVRHVAAASPKLEQTPFTGRLVGAIWLALTGAEGPDPAMVLHEAAQSATTEQLVYARERLTRIATANPDHADQINNLIAALAQP